MMFFKLLKYDIKRGIVSRYKSFIISSIIFIIFFIEYFMKSKGLDDNSFGNALLCVFSGIEEYAPSIDDRFNFPVIWLIIYLCISYFTLIYPLNDLDEIGQNLMLRSGGRRIWWLSKCLWNIVFCILYFLLAYLVILICCIITNIPITLNISQNIDKLLSLSHTNYLLHPHFLNVELFVLPLIINTALSMLQMTLSLFIKPVLSFSVTVVILLSSAYYMSASMIGNYLMPIRSSHFVLNGVVPQMGMIIAGVIIAICTITGSAYFNRYDVIKKGE